MTEEPLIDILDSLVGHSVYEAINAGQPERMGIAHGWELDTYLANSETTTPKGHSYRNLCIGCDRFHQEVLGPVLREMRDARRRKRLATMSQ